MKIVVLDGHALNPGDLSWDCLRQFGQLTVYDRTPADQVISRIGDADTILLNKVVITADILDGTFDDEGTFPGALQSEFSKGVEGNAIQVHVADLDFGAKRHFHGVCDGLCRNLSLKIGF